MTENGVKDVLGQIFVYGLTYTLKSKNPPKTLKTVKTFSKKPSLFQP